MKIITGVLEAVLIALMLPASTMAASNGAFYVNNAYFKGGGVYDVVVHDPNHEALKLYVNDKNPVSAKVNNEGWATFKKVNLSGQSKLSFARQVYSKYIPVNYVKYIAVSGSHVSLYDTQYAKAQTVTSTFGPRTKTSGCTITPNREQDNTCTPGAVFANVTKSMVCTKGYSSSVRNVSNATKSQVYAEYGITSHPSGAYEVDHLVPLELGGSNDIANLWPEAAEPTPGFHQKDEVEDYLHSQVCSGKMSLADAQQKEVHEWVRVYVGMFPAAPAPQPVPMAHPTPAPAPSPVVITPTPAPAPPAVEPAPAPVSSGVFYPNCTAARAAGVTPIYKGQPGYRPALDRDGDNIACE